MIIFELNYTSFTAIFVLFDNSYNQIFDVCVHLSELLVNSDSFNFIAYVFQLISRSQLACEAVIHDKIPLSSYKLKQTVGYYIYYQIYTSYIPLWVFNSVNSYFFLSISSSKFHTLLFCLLVHAVEWCLKRCLFELDLLDWNEMLVIWHKLHKFYDFFKMKNSLQYDDMVLCMKCPQKYL